MAQHQIQRLLPRHFKMINYHVAGMTNRQIADMLGVTEQSVGIVLRSPMALAEVQRQLKARNNGEVTDEAEAYASKARITLQQNSEKAAQTQVELLDSDDDSVRLRASGSILDRVLGRQDANASDGPHVKVEISAKYAQLLVTALNESKTLKEPVNGKADESAADGQDALSSEKGEVDVHQASVECTGE